MANSIPNEWLVDVSINLNYRSILPLRQICNWEKYGREVVGK